VHVGVRVGAVFPTRPAVEVREPAQGLRCQQRSQVAQRAKRVGARNRHQHAGL
jgi:hypothetical protein